METRSHLQLAGGALAALVVALGALVGVTSWVMFSALTEVMMSMEAF